MAEACYADQQMLGARGGKVAKSEGGKPPIPKPAPVTRAPKMAMKGGGKRKPGGGSKAAF